MHTSDQNPPQPRNKPQTNQREHCTTNQPVRHKGAMGEYVAHQQRRVEIDELDRLIGTLNRSINASSYELLVLIREFDERAGWLAWSFTDGVSWLRWRCDLGVGAAREKLRMAHALKELPLISREFSAGNLSYSKVRVLTRVADYENEEDLVQLARKMTVRHLTEHCKQRSNAQAESTGLAKAAQQGRNYRVWHDDQRGTLHLSIVVPAEEGALIEKAVEKAAVQQSAESGARFAAVDEEPSWGALQADAVVAVMRSFLSVNGSVAEDNKDTEDIGGALSASSNDTTTESSKASDCIKSQSTADHYQVVVHVDESALVSGGHALGSKKSGSKKSGSNNSSGNSNDLADSTPGGTPVPGCTTGSVSHCCSSSASSVSPASTKSTPTSQYPIETVRRLCCDGSIIPIIENAKGEPLNVGRKVRTITTAIRRALWSRDGGCAFPGCGHQRFVDAHHIRHWADGGETSVDNLVLLCSNHHKLVHEGGYAMGRDQSGQLFFKRPDGIAVPDCGYFRDDWIDAGGQLENTREFSSEFDVESVLSVADPDEVNEPRAEYVFPLVEVLH